MTENEEKTNKWLIIAFYGVGIYACISSFFPIFQGVSWFLRFIGLVTIKDATLQVYLDRRV